jgi:predicted RNase H-like HicB family nuclease/predicted XRE-type DNA-binding protein
MAAMKKKSFTARYSFEDGTWIVEIAEIPRVHTFGRTLAKAQANIRDALGLWLQVTYADALDIHDEFVSLPDDLVGVVSEAKDVRAQASELSHRAQELTARAAIALVRDAGMTVREAAQVLHISHQRVHQLVRGQSPSEPLPGRGTGRVRNPA